MAIVVALVVGEAAIVARVARLLLLLLHLLLYLPVEDVGFLPGNDYRVRRRK